MTWDASARVNDLFATSARVCTPAAATHMAAVLFTPVNRDPEAVSFASVLSDAEKWRAQNFLTEDGAAHFKQQRAFRRYCGALAADSALPLSRIVFAETEKGRPYLPELRNIWFSFSSCRLGYLGAWSSSHHIGVDIEDQTRRLEATELAQAYFSMAEAKAVEGARGPTGVQTFFKLWTLKEAALKSIGEGLPFGLDAFQFDLNPSIRIVDAPRAYGGPERFCAYAIETPYSCAALAVCKDR
jgi:phosphopantetheinyl transferase